MYQIYTFPNCDKCDKVKELLQERGIDYEEINLKSQEGKKVFGKIYKQVVDKLKRDEYGPLLPILVRKNESGIEAIAQTFEEARAII